MSSLIEVKAIKDGFMEGEDIRFCTKDKVYKVIYENEDIFAIYDNQNEFHSFNFNNCEWFELIYS